MKRLEKHNLKDMLIRAIALVDRGANNRKFFLIKRGTEMDKELALKLIKANPSLSAEDIASMVSGLSDDDRTEVEAFIASRGDLDVNKALEELLEKAGSKFSKKNAELITKVEGLVNSILKALKELKGQEGVPKDKYPIPEKKDVKKALAMLEAMDSENSVVKVLKAMEAGEGADDEISAEDFNKMWDAKKKALGL